jgi:tRNA (guanine37-N1)-methyltransferase
MLKIDILTLFPDMFKGPFAESIIKRACDRNLAEINIHYLRKWTHDKHQIVDDRPFGGGVGMLLKVEPIYEALQELAVEKFQKPSVQVSKQIPISNSKNSKSSKSKHQSQITNHQPHVILLTPQGQTFNQKKAQELSKLEHIILICGHYEGYDERIREYLVDEEISIGDYVLTGGELPAMVVTETTIRLIPGVLNKTDAAEFESFSNTFPSSRPNAEPTTEPYPLLEYPQYTHPSEFNGWKVPEVLLNGNHKEIDNWRKQEALKRTKSRRPDLLK